MNILAYHEVSIFPKKDLPFFILFTAGLCSGTATLALLTHQYPEYTAYVARMVHFFFLLYSRPELFIDSFFLVITMGLDTSWFHDRQN